LLRIIPSDDQVIYPEWIQYYDELPGDKHRGYRGTYAGVDLAISSKDTADFTAVVFAHVYSRCDKLRIYILPNPIMQKLNFPAQVDLMKNVKSTVMKGSQDTLFVESVAYQEALPQMLEFHGVEAEAIKPKGDKRTRLSLTSMSIKSGLIKFPRQGCEKLIEQLVGFGVEKHDDLADAFSLLINATLEKHADDGTIIMMWVGGIPSDDDVLYYRDYVDVE
jgi:predicted phage terminase large subunit-like protein